MAERLLQNILPGGHSEFMIYEGDEETASMIARPYVEPNPVDSRRDQRDFLRRQSAALKLKAVTRHSLAPLPVNEVTVLPRDMSAARVNL